MSTLDQFKEHPAWEPIKRSIKLGYSKREQYDEAPHPKFSIPVAKMDPSWAKIEVPCAACGQPTHPVRLRRTAKRDGNYDRTGAYISMTCPLTVNPGCSRTNEGKWSVAELEIELVNRVNLE